MRDFSLARVTPAASVFSLIIAIAAPAAAQTPAPAAAPPTTAFAPAQPAPNSAPAPQVAPAAQAAPAPPGYAPPPPGYQYAPAPGYAPPPAYTPPPRGYAYAYPAPPGYVAYPGPRVPESLPYNGGPIPQGYHLEERPRRGLIIGGALTLGIPWVLGMTIASTDDFSNGSGWLIAPTIGPWATIAARDKGVVCSNYPSSQNCDEYNAVRTMLILDGLTQAAGTIMLIYGLSSTKKVLARDFVSSLHFTPARMGKLGYGGVLYGEF